MNSRIELLSSLIACFPNNKVTEKTAEQYLLALKDIPEGLLSVAVERAKRECEFFPTIAKLRGLAKETVTLLRNKPKDFDEVWREIKHHIGAGGLYPVYYTNEKDELVKAEVKWSCEEVKQLVAFVGWDRLCTYETSQEETIKAQCRNAWADINARKDNSLKLRSAIKTLPKAEAENLLRIGTITKMIGSKF